MNDQARNDIFRLIFMTVAGMTMAAIVGQVALAWWWVSPTDNQQAVFGALGVIGQTGVGAIFGLLGGKAMRR